MTEINPKDFRCKNCTRIIDSHRHFGSAHRNHCPFCGYSLHVDNKKGDRTSRCGGLMQPVGLMYKGRQEICIVHICQTCGKINHNRIAGDDDTSMLEDIFEKSLNLMDEVKEKISKKKIKLMGTNDREDLDIQLYGKN